MKTKIPRRNRFKEFISPPSLRWLAATLLVATATHQFSADAAESALAPAYRVVDLGVLPGVPDDSFAWAVNNAGQVIGVSGGASPQGFIWDPTNGLRKIGVYGGNCTYPLAINNRGLIVGQSGDAQAIQWDAVNGTRWLGPGPIAGYPYYSAQAINDSGAISYDNWSWYGPPSKVYLVSGATATWIGEIYPNSYSHSFSLNNKNEMVGACSQYHYGPDQAFFWKSGQSIVALGFLPGYTNSVAYGINDSSQVVGYCASEAQTAFSWTSGGGMVQLGSSSIGGSNSSARGISAGGIAVGYCQISGTNHAVAWAPGQNAGDLNTLVQDLSGWKLLREAYGVNASGMIVGEGLRINGVQHAFILYPLADPPSIVSQPASAKVSLGGTASLTVGVAGMPPFAYQWQLNGTNLSDGSEFTGTTTSNLTINPVQLSDAGSYQVIITNISGSVTSLVAALTVNSTGLWTMTGAMSTVRAYHTATVLPNGKVLVAGGNDNSSTSPARFSAELYDPTSGTWTTTGSMNTKRAFHTATLLPNGKVLVTGGDSGTGGIPNAELYDPATGIWSTTSSMNSARAEHSATLLPDGKVLVAGGYRYRAAQVAGSVVASAEIYDPTTGTWTTTGSMTDARCGTTATLLPNGKVLVAGGFAYTTYGICLSSAELYDPSTRTWTTTDSMHKARNYHTATLLSNGKVLAAGGNDGISGISSAELYNPATGKWTATGAMATERNAPAATLLPDGKVLVVGGHASSGALSSAELYDPVNGIWTTTDSMHKARYYHTITLLSNGKVLAAGGHDGNLIISSEETYSASLQITSQPQSQTGYWGGTVMFSVIVTNGIPPWTYQWLKDGVAILDATNSSLLLAGLEFTNAGLYRVVISDATTNAALTSLPATLTVEAAAIALALYPGVTINGVSGRTYGIQTTNALASTNNSWVGVTNIVLGAPTQIWYDSQPASQPQRYYRVVPGPIPVP